MTSLAIDSEIDDRVLNMSPGHGFIVGETVCLMEDEAVVVNDNPDTTIDIGRFLQADVLSVAGDAVTIDTPLDYPFTTAAMVCRQDTNMAVDGSGEPVTFSIRPQESTQWDITRVIFYIQSGSNPAMNDQLFGNLTALTNGIVLRKHNEDVHNIFNVKKNGEFRLRNFDAVYVDTVRGGGSQSFSSRRTFGGQEKNGVVVRLTGANNDELQVIVQDDLSSLQDFKVIAQGHLVDPL
jgi:hypothetical protein